MRFGLRGIVRLWQKMSNIFPSLFSSQGRGKHTGFNWKFGNGPRRINQPGRTLPRGKGTARKQRPQCPDSAGLCLTCIPTGQGFSFLLILHFGASVTGPFSWNRLQKFPPTSDKLTAKLGLQIKWPGDKGERGKEEGGRNTNCPLKSKWNVSIYIWL